MHAVAPLHFCAKSICTDHACIQHTCSGARFISAQTAPAQTTLAPHMPHPSQVWLDSSRAAFAALTSDKQSREAAEAAADGAKSAAQPDDLIDFGHLKARRWEAELRMP